MRRACRVALLAAALGACAKRADDPRELDAAIAATEALALSFADSVRGGAVAGRERAAAAETPLVGGDTLSACADPLPTMGTQRFSTSLMSVHLPQDFQFTNARGVEEMAQKQGYARHEFMGKDRSTVSIYHESASNTHGGWTGLITSECDIQVGGHTVHVDLANASVYAPDRVVHAQVRLSPQLDMVFLGHARSFERQRDLLHAVRTLDVGLIWGRGSGQ